MHNHHVSKKLSELIWVIALTRASAFLQRLDMLCCVIVGQRREKALVVKRSVVEERGSDVPV